MDDFTRGSTSPNDPEPDWESAHPETHRHLLIALFPGIDVQTAIEKHREDWNWPKSHYFPASSRLHLTLHCFEDQRQEVIDRLDEALAQVPMQSMALNLNHSRTWRNDLAVIQPAEHTGLHVLHMNIVRAVRQAGIIAHVPKFTPHITIARRTTGAAYPRSLQPIPWTVSKFLLVRSFTSHPVRHEVLRSYGPEEDVGV
jgi:2'-5' RNA ligase